MNRKKNRRSETDPAAKGPSLRNYFLIAAFFLTAVALSTLFIRNTYRNLYYENVKNESGSLRAYADQQFMSYNSINWLVEYWRTTDMSQVWKTMSFDKWERLKNSFGKTIQDITPEDIADMTPEKQALFAEICYVTFVDSFEYFMIYLHVDSLYFEQYNSDTNEVTVILAHNANQSLLDLPANVDLRPDAFLFNACTHPLGRIFPVHIHNAETDHQKHRDCNHADLQRAAVDLLRDIRPVIFP